MHFSDERGSEGDTQLRRNHNRYSDHQHHQQYETGSSFESDGNCAFTEFHNARNSKASKARKNKEGVAYREPLIEQDSFSGKRLAPDSFSIHRRSRND